MKLKNNLTTIILIALLTACMNLPATASVADVPHTATERPITLPEPYNGSLELVKVEDSSSFCNKVESPLNLPSQGVTQLSFLPNRNCEDVNSDLDLFEIKERLYLVQRNARGFRLVDVTDPTQPNEIGLLRFKQSVRQEHITVFHQFNRHYLAMPLESPTPYGNFPCGLAIVEVTQPEEPVLIGRYDGDSLNSDVAWCNVHAAEIDTNENGNATFLFAATLNTADLRVLDIRNLNNIREINVFHQHIHPHGEYGSWAHRAAVVGDRVYISYWGGGVIIVDKEKLEMGFASDEVILTPLHSIDPEKYVTHDSQPTADGNFLFVNDMDEIPDGLRLFDIRDLASPRGIWASDIQDTETGQHTIQIYENFLFVPWFREGLRVFQFDLNNPDQPIVEQVAFQSVRKPPYVSWHGGIGALRVHTCLVEGVEKICIYASDEESGLIILALDDR